MGLIFFCSHVVTNKEYSHMGLDMLLVGKYVISEVSYMGLVCFRDLLYHYEPYKYNHHMSSTQHNPFQLSCNSPIQVAVDW